MARGALAADDAPVVAVVVTKGSVAPFDGVLLPDAVAVARGQELARLRAENQAWKDAPPGLPWWIVAVVGGLALGAGVGIGYAARR